MISLRSALAVGRWRDAPQFSTGSHAVQSVSLKQQNYQTSTTAEFDVMIVIVFNVLAAKLALHSCVVVVVFWINLH